MVIKFAIEPAAFPEKLGTSSRDLISFHKTLIHLWETYGILVDPGNGPNSIASELGSESLKPVRQLWLEAWKARARCRRTEPQGPAIIEWSTIESNGKLAAYGDRIEVALVDKVRGIGYLGIPNDDSTYGVHCEGVEAVLFPFLGESEKFAELISRTERQVIPSGSDVATVWEDWFQPFAVIANRITIIDRYLTTTKNLRGLIQILRFLTLDQTRCDLELFLSDPVSLSQLDLTVVALAEIFRDELNAMGCTLNTVSVFAVMDYAMTRDRYASFGRPAFHVGHGLPEIFSESVLSENHPCTLDLTSDGVNRIVQQETRRIKNRQHTQLLFERDSAGTWVSK